MCDSLIAFSCLCVACGGGGGGAQDEGVIQDLADAFGGDEVTTSDVLDWGGEEVEDKGIAEDTSVEVPFFCKDDQDCQDHPVGQCQRPVCEKATGKCGFEWVKTCALEAVLFEEDFEDGMPAGWVIEDNNPDDFVTWNVTDFRKAFGKYSLYLGHPKCHTYYNGQLDAECKPVEGGKKPSLVRVHITTPPIAIPPTQGTKVLSFYLWLDSEPLLLNVPEQPDQFRVSAILGEQTTQLYTSVEGGKTTNGKFVFITANLNQFTGKEIRIRFTFDTLDGTNNNYEGVYLDDVRVVSKASPKMCYEGDQCPDDGNICTDDGCSVFVNAAPNGYCAYPLIPTCVQPECTQATVSVDCPNAGECEEAKCIEGSCVYEKVPGCCMSDVLFSADFDDGSLQGFQVYVYGGEKNVKWQVSSHRSSSGQYSLYYGDTVKKNYDTPGKFNFGEATSPPLDLPPDGWIFMTFNLFLSTEFDDTLPEEYYNPLGADFFEVIIVENAGNPALEKKTTVWSSHNVYGTTHGEFIPVGIDLSGFAGKIIWLRFRFDTSDAIDNAHEGVYIDDVKVTFFTAGEACPPRKNCMTKFDCRVDGVCRVGDCVENVCQVESVGTPPDCCATHYDCDDQNPCTADGCIGHKCYNEFVEGPGCCMPQHVKTFDFDVTPLDNFSVVDDGTEVKWQNTTALVHSPPNALYFGNGTNYDNGKTVKGSAISPPILLPSLPLDGKLYLSFYLYLDVEKNLNFDKFWVEIVAGDKSTVVFTKANVPEIAYKTWFQVSGLDISAYQKQSVQIRFSFDSVNEFLNDGFGVVVDDVVIEKVCLLP